VGQDNKTKKQAVFSTIHKIEKSRIVAVLEDNPDDYVMHEIEKDI
jgi:hypothetical protein